MTRPDDPSHDERLHAALRHAPDADVQAPPLVSARILAAARQAADEDLRRRPWWRRLTRPQRMGASGAFASVLLAGFIGLLWQGEPPPVVAPLPAAAPAPSAPSTTAPVADTPSTTRADDLLMKAPPPRARGEAAIAAKVPARPAAHPAAPAAEAAAPPPAAEANGAAAPAPAPKAKLEAAQAQDPGQAAEPLAASRPAARSLAASPPPAAGIGMGLSGAARQGFAPWTDAAVLWQLSADSAPAPADTAWLQALARATQGRWGPVARADAPAAALRLALARAGSQAQLALGDDRVQWCSGSDGPCWGAALAPADAQALRQALQR